MWPLPSQPGVGQLAKEKKRENRARLHARPDRVELCGPTGFSKESEHNPHAQSTALLRLAYASPTLLLKQEKETKSQLHFLQGGLKASHGGATQNWPSLRGPR